MATELKFDEEDENSPSGSVGAAMAGGTQAGPGGAARPVTPSGRPNVQQYIDANKGAGDRLATGITGKVEKQADKINQGVQNSREKLETGANPLESKLGDQGKQFSQAAFKDPQALLSAANANAGSPTAPAPVAGPSGGGGFNSGATTGGPASQPVPANQPSQFDANSLAEFKRLMSGGYGQNIQGLGTQVANQQQNLQGQANQLAGKAGLANSEAGRFELLRSTLGQPNYTSGQQRLDQLFLQAQPGVNRSLQQNLQGINKSTSQGIQGFTSDSTARLNALQGLSSNRSDEIGKMLSGGVDQTGLESDISGRGLSDIKNSSQAKLDAAKEAVAKTPELRARLQNGTLTQQDIQSLGLQVGTQLYDADLSKFLTNPDGTPTMANTADPAEAARYRALQQLSGGTEADIYGGEAQLGGFKPVGYNSQGLAGEIAAKKNYWEVEKPKQSANQLADIFASYGGAGMQGAVTPLAQYGAGVLAPQLRNATNLDEIKGILSNYEQVAASQGVPASYLYSKYPQFAALRDQIAASEAKRVRTLQPGVADLEGGGNFNVT